MLSFMLISSNTATSRPFGKKIYTTTESSLDRFTTTPLEPHIIMIPDVSPEKTSVPQPQLPVERKARQQSSTKIEFAHSGVRSCKEDPSSNICIGANKEIRDLSTEKSKRALYSFTSTSSTLRSNADRAKLSARTRPVEQPLNVTAQVREIDSERGDRCKDSSQSRCSRIPRQRSLPGPTSRTGSSKLISQAEILPSVPLLTSQTSTTTEAPRSTTRRSLPVTMARFHQRRASTGTEPVSKQQKTILMTESFLVKDSKATDEAQLETLVHQMPKSSNNTQEATEKKLICKDALQGTLCPSVNSQKQLTGAESPSPLQLSEIADQESNIKVLESYSLRSRFPERLAKLTPRTRLRKNSFFSESDIVSSKVDDSIHDQTRLSHANKAGGEYRKKHSRLINKSSIALQSNAENMNETSLSAQSLLHGNVYAPQGLGYELQSSVIASNVPASNALPKRLRDNSHQKFRASRKRDIVEERRPVSSQVLERNSSLPVDNDQLKASFQSGRAGTYFKFPLSRATNTPIIPSPTFLELLEPLPTESLINRYDSPGPQNYDVEETIPYSFTDKGEETPSNQNEFSKRYSSSNTNPPRTIQTDIFQDSESARSDFVSDFQSNLHSGDVSFISKKIPFSTKSNIRLENEHVFQPEASEQLPTREISNFQSQGRRPEQGEIYEKPLDLRSGLRMQLQNPETTLSTWTVPDQKPSSNEPNIVFNSAQTLPGSMNPLSQEPLMTNYRVKIDLPQAGNTMPSPLISFPYMGYTSQPVSITSPQPTFTMESILSTVQRQKEEQQTNFAAQAIIGALKLQAEMMQKQQQYSTEQSDLHNFNGMLNTGSFSASPQHGQIISAPSFSDGLIGSAAKNEISEHQSGNVEGGYRPSLSARPNQSGTVIKGFRKKSNDKKKPSSGLTRQRVRPFEDIVDVDSLSDDEIVFERPKSRKPLIVFDGPAHRKPFNSNTKTRIFPYSTRPLARPKVKSNAPDVITLYRQKRQDGYIYPSPTGSSRLDPSPPGAEAEEGYEYPQPVAQFPPAVVPDPELTPNGPSLEPNVETVITIPKPSPSPPNLSPITPDRSPGATLPPNGPPVRPKPTPPPNLTTSLQPTAPYNYPTPDQPLLLPGSTPVPSPEGSVELPGPPEEPIGPQSPTSEAPYGPSTPKSPQSPSETEPNFNSEEGYNYSKPDKTFN